ncbi:MAG: hypothetical protein ABIW30_02000 [Arenimonas sp.]
MNWNPEQQRLLGAMGYQLLVRVDPSMRQGRSTGATVAASAAGRTTTAGAASPATPAVARAASMHGSQAVFPALRAALKRAAGGADIAAILADLDVLRRQPSAKRALWPRLRALRRTP